TLAGDALLVDTARLTNHTCFDAVPDPFNCAGRPLSRPELNVAVVTDALLLGVGPSLGQLYAGDGRHAIFSSVARTALALGFSATLVTTLNPDSGGGPNGGLLPLVTVPVMVALSVPLVLLTVRDVRRSVRAPRAETPAKVSLSPAPLAAPGGQSTLGLSLS